MMKLLNLKPHLFFIAIFLLYLTGCDKNKESNDYSSLGKAIARSTETINELMSGAKLAEIEGIEIDQNGNITSYGEWTFYYFREAGALYDFYAITIYPDGEVFQFNPAGSICYIEIPMYISADEWIAKADGVMNEHGIDYNFRTLQVFADFENIYPDTEFNVIVHYYLDSGNEHIAYVVLDADTNTVLFVEDNP
jgi:hypothetical protein